MGMTDSQRRPSTWWVGRGSEPRAWWRDGVFPLVLMSWFTFNYFIVPDSRNGWWLVAGWVASGAYVGWLFWRHHRAARESRVRTQIDR